MKTTTAARDPAMDIIRIAALLGVVSTHFFLKTDFYYVYITGPRMYLLTVLYSMSRVCVPMFLMLSGYLLNRKQPDRRYFSKLGKTLTTYVLASVCCYLYARFFSFEAPGSGSPGELIRQILSFRAAPYSWYINMYIGLFLLIPYLNLIFHSLSGEKARRQLLLVLLILTSVPYILNAFRYDAGWYPVEKDLVPDQLFPNYWTSFYPVTYYMLGAYLREHPLRITRRTNLVLMLAAGILYGTANYLLCRGNYYHNGPWQEWGALPNVIQSALLFHYLAHGNYSRLGIRTCRILKTLSGCCLGAYLVSWIFDSIFYRFLHQLQPSLAYQLPFYPVMLILVAGCSLALAGILELFSGCLFRLLPRLLPGK